MSYKNDNLLNEYVDLLPLARNRTVRKHQFLFDAALDKISDTRNAIVDKMDKGDEPKKVVYLPAEQPEREVVMKTAPVMLSREEIDMLRQRNEFGRTQNKIPVIKMVRERTNMSLLDTKNLVEHYMDLMGVYS